MISTNKQFVCSLNICFVKMNMMRIISAVARIAMVTVLAGHFLAVAQEQSKKTNKIENIQQVRKELEAVFAERIEASKANDIEKGKRLVTQDFSVKLPHGKVLTRSEVEELSKLDGDAKLPHGEPSFVIEKLEVKGNQTILQVRYTYTYRQKLKDGAIGEITISEPRQETWLKTEDGWKLKFINMNKQQVTLNGKKVDGLHAIPTDPSQTSMTTDAASDVPKDKALVFIYRIKASPFSLIKLPLYIDDVEIASVSQGRYVKVILDPGSYELRSDKQPTISINVQGGQIYYFELKIEAGFPRGRGRLVAVEERIGAPVLKVPKLLELEPLDPGNIKDPTKVIIEKDGDQDGDQ